VSEIRGIQRKIAVGKEQFKGHHENIAHTHTKT